MARKQIQRAEAVRNIASIRERLQTLKEQMEPLPFSLAQNVNVSLHSLRILEDRTGRYYRCNEETP